MLQTRSPEPESEVGVRSPPIVKNIGLIVLTIFVQMYNMICGLCACVTHPVTSKSQIHT